MSNHRVELRCKACCAASKYPQPPILRTTDPAAREQFYTQTDADSLLGPRQTMAGFIQHPSTGYYQVWLSTNGYDVTCLCAHFKERDAVRAIQKIKAVLGSEDYYQEENIVALLSTLKEESDAEPCPLPDSLVRQITRAILRAVVDPPPYTD